MPNSLNKPKTVAILGAGPVGLAAAAHVLERGMQPVVLEAGPAGRPRRAPVEPRPLFSPWEYAIDKAVGAPAGGRWLELARARPVPDRWRALAQYLEPLATRTPLKDHIRTSSMVTSVGRAGFDKMKSNGRAFAPFDHPLPERQGPEQLKADAVIDATGTWFSPNPAGADGLPAVGERETQDRIAYGMPDVLGRERGRYAGRTVAVLGAGHSAIGTLIDLVRLKEEAPATEVIWLLRGDKPEKAFGGGANDKLAARGALGTAFAKLVMDGKICVETGFRVSHIDRDGEKLRIGAGIGVHAAASSPSTSWSWRRASAPTSTSCARCGCRSIPPSSARPTLAPLIDPNLHSCGTVRPHGARELAQPEPGFYFAGMKSYGRAPTFLMLTGYEQVRSIVAEIAGDHEAAARVELVLPETGVCSGPGPEANLAKAEASAAGCCGGPAPEPTAAETPSGCCVADVKAKQEGKKGCGC